MLAVGTSECSSLIAFLDNSNLLSVCRHSTHPSISSSLYTQSKRVPSVKSLMSITTSSSLLETFA